MTGSVYSAGDCGQGLDVACPSVSAAIRLNVSNVEGRLVHWCHVVWNSPFLISQRMEPLEA